MAKDKEIEIQVKIEKTNIITLPIATLLPLDQSVNGCACAIPAGNFPSTINFSGLKARSFLSKFNEAHENSRVFSPKLQTSR